MPEHLNACLAGSVFAAQAANDLEALLAQLYGDVTWRSPTGG
jgi:hypothetical protein